MTDREPVDRLRAVHTALEERLGQATAGPWLYEPNPSFVVTAAHERRSLVSCWNVGAEQNNANAVLIALAPVALRVLRDQAAELLAEWRDTLPTYQGVDVEPKVERWLATSADLVAGLGMETP